MMERNGVGVWEKDKMKIEMPLPRKKEELKSGISVR